MQELVPRYCVCVSVLVCVQYVFRKVSLASEKTVTL